MCLKVIFLLGSSELRIFIPHNGSSTGSLLFKKATTAIVDFEHFFMAKSILPISQSTFNIRIAAAGWIKIQCCCENAGSHLRHAIHETT